MCEKVKKMLYYYVKESFSQCMLESNIDVPIDITASSITIDDSFVLVDTDFKDNKFLLFNTDTLEIYLSKTKIIEHPAILHFYPRVYLNSPVVLLTSLFNETDENDQEAIIGSGKLNEIDTEFVGISLSVTDTNGNNQILNSLIRNGEYTVNKLTSKHEIMVNALETYIDQHTPLSIIHLESGVEVYDAATKKLDLTKTGTYILILGYIDGSEDVKITDHLVSVAHYKEIFYVI